MVAIRFPYRRDPKQASWILKPFIAVEFYSELTDEWIAVSPVLADTGADYTTLPSRFGRLLVAEIESGQPISVRGLVTGTSAAAYLHSLTARLAGTEFDLPVAISTDDNTPPIFGRTDALDRLSVTFQFGETVVIEAA